MEPIVDMAARLQSFGAIGGFLLFFVKATLILGVVRLLLAAIPNSSAATRHLGVTLALCGVLALPVIGFLVPSWSVPLLSNAEPVRASGGIGVTGSEDDAPTALDAAITVARATGVVPQSRINAVSNAFQQVKNSWQGLVLLAVFAVSGLLLVRMLVGMAGVARVARGAEEIRDDAALLELDAARDHLRLDREVRLLRSPRISMPVVWGFLKPVLLLPASSSDWSSERLRVVLMHELAHVRRHDGITLLVTRAAVAMFWFHPLMWTLERLGRSECERACDDLVLASGTRPSEYAEHLLSIARAIPHADPFRSVTLAMTRRSQLEGRLLSILQPNARRGSFSGRMVIAFVISAVLVLVPVAAMKVVAAPPPDQVQKPDPEGIVEIGPSIAAKIVDGPETLFAQFENYKSRKRGEAPSTASGWYERGMELHHEDRYPEAIKAFERAIEARYRVDSSMYNIACGYALLGDRNNAMRYLRDAVGAGFDSAEHIAEDSDLDPLRSDPEFQGLLRGLAGAQDHKDKTEDRLQATLEKYDDLNRSRETDGGDWSKVGLHLLRLRQFDQSIDALQKALRTGSKTATTMYNLACAHSLKGDTNQAADWLQRAIDNGFDSVEKIKNDPDLRNLRSNPRFAEMIRVADDLRLRNAGWKGPEWLFGNNDEAEWREMLPHYQSMTRKYADNGRAWFNLGYAQLQAGQNQASAESFKRAVQLNYRPGASNYNAACAYAKADKHDQAFDQLNKARATGFKLKSYLEGDDDLDNIRSDSRFRELRRQVRAEADKDHDKHDKHNVY